MSIEEIIRYWKTDVEPLEASLPISPIGQELPEEELLEISGGDAPLSGCQTYSCQVSRCYEGTLILV